MPAQTTRPHRIDTHAAYIFLVGERAWKLKRAVRMSYLDFGTPERRRDALDRELRLNRRTAAHLYLAVHAISRAPSGALGIDGPGKAVDWLLEMRRFPDGALFADLARSRGLTDVILIRLTDRIAAFHGASEPRRGDDGAARFRKVVDDNIAAMRAAGNILPGDGVDRLAAMLNEAQERLAPLIDQRGREGHIRLGHGDLHLGNIALVDGEPVPFDCLEFDEELATVDLLYDLAFLVMDLWQQGMRGPANLIFNRYLDLSAREEGGIALLPLYLSVRAAIRAHVLATQSIQAQDGGKAADARHHLELAIALVPEEAPRLVAVGGLSGTGKSTVARRLAPDLGRAPGARILRSDVLRKRAAALPPEGKLPADAYTAEASAAVYHALTDLADGALAGGHSVVADAVFARPGERSAIAAVAAERSCGFTGFWLETPTAIRAARVGARRNDASDADATVAEAQGTYDVGDLGDWTALDSSGAIDDIAEAALAALRGR